MFCEFVVVIVYDGYLERYFMMFMRCMLEFVLEKKSGGNFVEYWLNLFKSMKIIVLVEVVVFGRKRKFEWLK